MKRVREDAQPTGPMKRSSGPPRPTQAPAQPTTMGGTKLTTNDALSYLREVKNRFADQKDVYDTFLEIMKEFKAAKIDTTGVIHKVKQLFKGHRELILGFNTFLPRGYEIELQRISDDEEEEDQGNKQPVEFDQAINYVNKIKTRFANDERVYKAFLEILNMYRKGQKTINQVYDEVAVLFRSHQDLLEEFTYFLPDGTQSGAANRQRAGFPPQRRPGQGPVQQVPGRVRVPPQPYPGGPISPDMRNLHHKRKTKTEGGFRRDGDEEDDMGRSGRPQLAKELVYFERAKQRLRNKDAYNDFLKCLSMYTQEIISRQELLQLLNDIIGRFPDLMTGFHEFVAKCDLMEIDENKVRGLAAQNLQRQRMREEELQRQKYLTKPLSEIVSGDTERVTPSYVKMPPGYPHLVSSGRTPLAETVLNSEFVNVITGSEDYSFKLMRKNQYEESLFRCEDDRYEFEMAIERNVATMKRLKPIAQKIATMTPEERASFKFDDSILGPVHWRSIERLYADQGPVLIDLLRKNPVVAIPVVVTRLEQKDEEWRRVRVEMTRVWKRIYEANYHKSLDHRSFYFKQAEKRALLPKTLVAEVREAADRRRQDERSFRSLSPAYRYDPVLESSNGDLTYDYSEKSVFGDIYRILRTAVDESLGGGHREQVLELYLGLLEPFFGQEVRQAELEVLRSAVAESEDDGDAAGSRPSVAAGGRGRGAHRGRGSHHRHHHNHHNQQATAATASATAVPGGTGVNIAGAQGAGGTAGGAVEGGEADVKSESSDQDGMKARGDEEMTDLENKTPQPGATPEPRPVEEAAVVAGVKEAGASDKEAEDDETSADAGRGPQEDSMGAAGTGDGTNTQGAISDARMDRAYAACKPLAAFTGGPSASDVPLGHHLLFGNENIYIFYRYHRILFDRLCTARKCVQAKCNAAAANSGRQHQSDSNLGGAVTPEAPEARCATANAFEELHSSFMSMLVRVIRGQLESSVYEDQCRSLLGTGSYELFTLDKLSAKIVKHMQLMLQDETTTKLWELYKYERSRTVPIHTTLYHVNCHAVLTDDPCFRIAYNTSNSSLTITLVEPDKAPEALANAAEGYVTDYIKRYVSTPTAAPTTDCLLYLKRNLSQRARQGPDAELVEVLRSVAIFNGLECKISCTTSKVSYVLDTEDIMCRKLQQRRSEPDSQKQLRSDRFTRWLDERTAIRSEDVEAIMALGGSGAGGAS
ncbi:hypothetical protein Vretimale_4724 [Volvox reticuliferus]|uniref:Histone deacetylase interacting domain-containing protein n=1 Tax=Volvox reticuliferus TaxID=1737510 RepID=A0A8J4DHJ9_9CHLO|nr:hypothetical protein Vretifemale_3325 [Volvox reticuliferus]GIL99586.1 hypothetical protein Vretimale_4724 [Volvox reticuliferus]